MQVVLGETFCTANGDLGFQGIAGIRGTGRREVKEEMEAWEEPSLRVCFQAYAPGFLFISTDGSVGSHSNSLLHPISDSHQYDHE